MSKDDLSEVENRIRDDEYTIPRLEEELTMRRRRLDLNRQIRDQLLRLGDRP